MTLQALSKRLAVAEMPVDYGARPTGSFSKLSTWSDGFPILRCIFLLFRDYKPLLFLTGLAGLVVLASIGSGIAPVRPRLRKPRGARPAPLRRHLQHQRARAPRGRPRGAGRLPAPAHHRRPALPLCPGLPDPLLRERRARRAPAPLPVPGARRPGARGGLRGRERASRRLARLRGRPRLPPLRPPRRRPRPGQGPPLRLGRLSAEPAARSRMGPTCRGPLRKGARSVAPSDPPATIATRSALAASAQRGSRGRPGKASPIGREQVHREGGREDEEGQRGVVAEDRIPEEACRHRQQAHREHRNAEGQRLLAGRAVLRVEEVPRLAHQRSSVAGDEPGFEGHVGPYEGLETRHGSAHRDDRARSRPPYVSEDEGQRCAEDQNSGQVPTPRRETGARGGVGGAAHAREDSRAL